MAAAMAPGEVEESGRSASPPLPQTLEFALGTASENRVECELSATPHVFVAMASGHLQPSAAVLTRLSLICRRV